MQVMGTDAVLLPTQVEGVVKQQVPCVGRFFRGSRGCQVSLRQEKHMETNNARALTKDEKKAKEERKLLKGCDVQIHVAAFRSGEARITAASHSAAALATCRLSRTSSRWPRTPSRCS